VEISDGVQNGLPYQELNLVNGPFSSWTRPNKKPLDFLNPKMWKKQGKIQNTSGI
jgi:hypothetical protein